MNSEMRKRAMATRDAHLALLELKKLVDEATRRTHAAELEAIHLAISSTQSSVIRTTLKVVMEHVKSAKFDATLSQVREKLEEAAA
jgi:hypothetical protein